MIPASCKICAGPTDYIGVVDFYKNCAGHKFTPIVNAEEPKCSDPAGCEWPEGCANPCRVPLSHARYYQCQRCHFLFTPALDSWTSADFQNRIYNDDYDRVDPEFVTGERARRNAGLVMRCIPPNTTLLDFAGGNGGLCMILTQEGFSYAVSHDFFTNELTRPVPEAGFDFITCFEVLEHSTNPKQTVEDIASLLSPSGVVFFSTHTLGLEYAFEGLEWWYIGPRNGHVSIFSKESLRVLWDSVGFNVIHLTPNRHFAQRRP